jgi:hypothetical protein
MYVAVIVNYGAKGNTKRALKPTPLYTTLEEAAEKAASAALQVMRTSYPTYDCEVLVGALNMRAEAPQSPVDLIPISKGDL